MLRLTLNFFSMHSFVDTKGLQTMWTFLTIFNYACIQIFNIINMQKKIRTKITLF